MTASGTFAVKPAKEPSAREAVQPEPLDGLQAANLIDNYSTMVDNPISINYSDEKLRILVEEFITQQRGNFTLKCACSYILYWAMEEGKASQSGNDLFEGDKICQADCDRIKVVLDKIVGEGRLVASGEQFKKLMH